VRQMQAGKQYNLVAVAYIVVRPTSKGEKRLTSTPLGEAGRTHDSLIIGNLMSDSCPSERRPIRPCSGVR